ncbi:MAG: ACT domain-containing protein [Acidobacteria bacterium]|nr:ACT domain-containing protein [Acidobacteriota bacterium]
MRDPRPIPRIAFQGERGAFSEEAAVRLLGERIVRIPRPTFESLFSAIRDGVADCILAPMENSLAGSVHRSYDLLLESGLHITGEVVLRVAHCLIGCPGSSFERIRTVESHPVALAQCERFFAAHPHIRRIATDDTAGSVRAVVQRGSLTRAAIAGRRAAEAHGGRILRRNLEDHRENYTRFALLIPSLETPRGANKVSLVMRLGHRPGTLHRVLGLFARRRINLLKIESRPIQGRPWQYHFYLDLCGLPDDPRLIAALAELEKCADWVRLLGWYRAASATPAVRQRVKKGAKG